MNPIKPAILALSLLSLTACSGSKKEQPKLDYQSQNRKVVNLEVPPDLTNPGQNSLYQLPAGSGAVRASDVNRNRAINQHAGGQTVLAGVSGVKMERDGSQRWLTVSGKKPAELWPLLKTFWQESGFTIASEEPAIGQMETDWAENRAKLSGGGLRSLLEKIGLGGVYSTSERDKFIIRIEQAKNGGTDIFFAHKGMSETYTDRSEERTMWQPRPNDPNLEAAFLARFMQYVGVDEAEAQRQVAVQADRDQGTEFAKREANTVLITGSAERNVNRVGSALNRIGLVVQQFVSERGMFIVRPAPTQSEELAQAAADNRKAGLLSRWFKGKKDKQPVAASNQPAQLLVGLVQEPNGQRVVLLDQTGKPLNDARANKWIRDLYNELK